MKILKILTGSIFAVWISTSCSSSKEKEKEKEQEAKVSRLKAGQTASDPEAILGDKFVRRAQWEVEARDYEELETREKDAIALESGKNLMTLHHTSSNPSDELESVRAALKLHVETWGWADLGYHFVIGTSGRIFEGRPLRYLGAHTAKLNTGNIGIAFAGCFDPQGCAEQGKKVSEVTPEMIDSAARLAAYLAVRYDLEINRETLQARSVYEKAKTGVARFPYSPGKLIVERLDEIIFLAKAYLPQAQADWQAHLRALSRKTIQPRAAK